MVEIANFQQQQQTKSRGKEENKWCNPNKQTNKNRKRRGKESKWCNLLSRLQLLFISLILNCAEEFRPQQNSASLLCMFLPAAPKLD